MTNSDRLTLTVPEAGQIIGISRGCAYEAARRGDIPTIRIGGRLVVPTAKLMRMLGAETSTPSEGKGSNVGACGS